MKAVLSDEPFSDPDWIFERKLDGVRCVAQKQDRQVRLVSRTGRLMNGSYPELIEALERERCPDVVADGEIVAFRGAVTSFFRLQGRMQVSSPDAARRSGVPVFLYLFDLLRLEGEDLRRLPLRERKARLRRSLFFHGPVRFTPHRNEKGEELFREACAKGLEGVIAKRPDSPYKSGGRSRDWLKLKCHAEQELVIGGFTAPKGSRTEFGALLVGHYDDGDLRYAGKVGTGFGRATLTDLGRRMRASSRTSRPSSTFIPSPAAPAGCARSWWPRSASANGPATAAFVIRAFWACATTSPPVKGARAPVMSVEITHPEKLLFPAAGVTKADLASYYERVSEWMLPHIKNRPLSLQRFPDGIEGKGFFHKDVPDYFPAFVRRVELPKREGGTITHALANDARSLVYLVGQNTITPHVWLSRADRLDQPDRLVFDLDPPGALRRRSPRRPPDRRPSAGDRPRPVRPGDRSRKSTCGRRCGAMPTSTRSRPSRARRRRCSPPAIRTSSPPSSARPSARDAS